MKQNKEGKTIAEVKKEMEKYIKKSVKSLAKRMDEAKKKQLNANKALQK